MEWVIDRCSRNQGHVEREAGKGEGGGRGGGEVKGLLLGVCVVIGVWYICIASLGICEASWGFLIWGCGICVSWKSLGTELEIGKIREFDSTKLIPKKISNVQGCYYRVELATKTFLQLPVLSLAPLTPAHLDLP